MENLFHVAKNSSTLQPPAGHTLSLYLLEHLTQNRKQFVKKFSGTVQTELIEDCISIVSQRLLENEYTAQYPQSWLYMAIKNEILSQIRNKKKNVRETALAKFTAPCEFTFMEDTEHLNWRVSKVLTAVETLTNGQREAIHFFLSTGRVTDPKNGVVNTQKALYLQAVRALRIKFL